MQLIFRMLALIIVVPAAFYFVFWVPLSLMPFTMAIWLKAVIAFSIAAAVGWFVWQALSSRGDGLVSAVLLGALLFGGLGFVAGFFGPMIFAPDANQGPLLGILITGPSGFIVGGIMGYIFWVRQHSDADDEERRAAEAQTR